VIRSTFRLLLGKRLPIVSGDVAIPGLRAPIVIRRDRYGVAYIEAQSDDDAFYGIGFCHGQDRAFHAELYVRCARGTLAEVIGEEMLDVDRLSRRIGFARIAEAQLAVCAPHVRAQMESYARGINDGVAHGLARKPHELAILGSDPVTFRASDSLAVLQFFAFALSSNWDAELARLEVLRADGRDALLALEAADPSLLRDERLERDLDLLEGASTFAAAANHAVRVAGAGAASNNWAIAPSRTKSGRAIVCGDPHLAPTLPAPWYLVHVRTPTWAMSGASLVTQPIVSYGHNERVAWALTAGHVDNTDLFVERLGPDGTTVREGDRFVTCEARDEIIRVKSAPDVRERVLVTPRGPIVSPALGKKHVLSLRGTWMAARPVGGYDTWRARSVEEARRSFTSYPATSENRVFADVDGGIAWQMVGDAPVRKRGSGLLPMIGWDRASGWEDDPVPFDDMPRAIDPKEGFVASANQLPRHDGKRFFGADWLDDRRYRRIVERLAERTDWDVASCAALQLDRTSIAWRELRDAVLPHAAGEARSLLGAWDGVVAPDSAAAAVFELFFAEMMVRVARAKAPNAWRAAIGEGTNAVLVHGIMALRRVDHLVRLLREKPDGWFTRGWQAEMHDAFTAAIDTLRREAGADPRDWEWGRVRPLVLRHPFGAKRPFDRIFDLGPIAVGGDVTTIPQASVDFADPLGDPIGVANLRMVVDVGAWENGRYVLAGGQSGNPLSPHYADMLPLWERGEGVPIAWSPASVLAAARNTLRLVPG
jgi:penicillin amidase